MYFVSRRPHSDLPKFSIHSDAVSPLLFVLVDMDVVVVVGVFVVWSLLQAASWTRNPSTNAMMTHPTRKSSHSHSQHLLTPSTRFCFVSPELDHVAVVRRLVMDRAILEAEISPQEGEDREEKDSEKDGKGEGRLKGK